ncbi:hypothetical protein MHBO_001509 [Bonamia ostreae]|uniref:J domain-containing protein n=1 Tax=Bonamia ostreae TaxID=126728 RepID=A0ABV2AJ87_9EUKA
MKDDHEKCTKNKKLDKILNSDSPFKTLGLPFPILNLRKKPVWTVLQNEIEVAFKKSSLIVHPDKNDNSENSQIAFSKVREAYENLSDFTKRAECIKKYIANNTHPKLGFIPEKLKNASKEEIDKFRHKSRRREKRLKEEHFELYGDTIKKQFFERRKKADRKRSEKQFLEEENNKKEKNYFHNFENRFDDKSDEIDKSTKILEKLKRKRKRRAC